MRYPFHIPGLSLSITALLCGALTSCVAEDPDLDDTFEESESALMQDASRAIAKPIGQIDVAGNRRSEFHSHQTDTDTGQAGSIDSGSIHDDSNRNEAAAAGQALFQSSAPWTKDVSGLTRSSRSDKIIKWLDSNGGWGGGVMRIDFGLTILQADSSTPKKTFTPTDEFYSPDCDKVPFPVPATGAIESEPGYTCTADGDCHLIVVHKSENKLYEMWRANLTGGKFYGGCAAVWDLGKTYPETLRGEGCTSADAGGFPITAMTFTAEEVQAGAIHHALRFILPNKRIRKHTYVRPATHSTKPTSGGVDAPPYGVRFRLRQDYPLQNLPSDGARVIAKALQTYGMFLSDGGNITLTGASDRYSNVKWDDLGVDSHSLKKLKVSDMEVVDMGEPIEWSGECVRN